MVHIWDQEVAALKDGDGKHIFLYAIELRLTGIKSDGELLYYFWQSIN